MTQLTWEQVKQIVEVSLRAAKLHDEFDARLENTDDDPFALSVGEIGKPPIYLLTLFAQGQVYTIQQWDEEKCAYDPFPSHCVAQTNEIGLTVVRLIQNKRVKQAADDLIYTWNLEHETKVHTPSNFSHSVTTPKPVRKR